MRTLHVVLVLLLSICIATAGHVDTVHVPKDRPTDLLGSIREKVISKDVVIEVRVTSDTTETYHGNDVRVFSDSVLWITDDDGAAGCSTDKVVSILLPPKGIGVVGGLLIGVLPGALLGAFLDAYLSATSDETYEPLKYGAIGALIGGGIGFVWGQATSADGTMWIFEH